MPVGCEETIPYLGGGRQVLTASVTVTREDRMRAVSLNVTLVCPDMTATQQLRALA